MKEGQIHRYTQRKVGIRARIRGYVLNLMENTYYKSVILYLESGWVFFFWHGSGGDIS